VTKFCTSVDIQGIITHATVWDDRLRGLGVAMGRISHFPMTCVVAITTLSLTCESVIAAQVVRVEYIESVNSFVMLVLQQQKQHCAC